MSAASTSASVPVRLPLDRLETFVATVLERRGMSRENAGVVARVMTEADTYGISSHGAAKLPAYLARVDSGAMELEPEIVVERETASGARVNAGNGFGQIAASRGMRLAMDRAAATGVGFVSVAHSNHFGVAGHYVRTAASEGMIGIAMTNASPAIAPFNGTLKLFGTNPVAFGIPAGAQTPVVLDMSSSMVARGRIRREIDAGETEIPLGWANDADGRATTDPVKALEGSLAPIGGAKGAGLALIVELLTGALTGSAEVGRVANLYDTSGPANTAHAFIAIDPDAFVGRAAFIGAVEATLGTVIGMTAVDGTAVRYPGLVEEDRAREITRDGAPLSHRSVDGLNELAAAVGLPPLH